MDNLISVTQNYSKPTDPHQRFLLELDQELMPSNSIMEELQALFMEEFQEDPTILSLEVIRKSSRLVSDQDKLSTDLCSGLMLVVPILMEDKEVHILRFLLLLKVLIQHIFRVNKEATQLNPLLLCGFTTHEILSHYSLIHSFDKFILIS